MFVIAFASYATKKYAEGKRRADLEIYEGGNLNLQSFKLYLSASYCETQFVINPRSYLLRSYGSVSSYGLTPLVVQDLGWTPRLAESAPHS
ncbi:hypothetical protein BDP27DRAFT_1318432 [Rhodocollybia butyracea]|uniref:Uncharacterized protein n=1 Tax=Rhodocollybia butyracea TaxID=206335 RepID=A0A9P5Q2I7_9AGAR|nr:hypothetical protein BDP27DRAFT_1318432 [Rhodocollybia butyracea]